VRKKYDFTMTYLDDIENEVEFEEARQKLQNLLESDEALYMKFMGLFVELMNYRYVSNKNWMGIPIVKLPEDILVIQEFYFDYKPTAVIEIGVARGGSVALAISLQKLNEIKPNVLGLDIKMYEHTHLALKEFLEKKYLKLVETDSTSVIAEQEIKKFVGGHDRVFAILDSNHSHAHVMRELELLDKCLPVGSVVLVADGIIEHLPERDDRPWGKGDNPLTATIEFLDKNQNWSRLSKFSQRSLFSEFRDGWITKLK
jgi:cephalosporin hydroxylase